MHILFICPDQRKVWKLHFEFKASGWWVGVWIVKKNMENITLAFLKRTSNIGLGGKLESEIRNLIPCSANSSAGMRKNYQDVCLLIHFWLLALPDSNSKSSIITMYMFWSAVIDRFKTVTDVSSCISWTVVELLHLLCLLCFFLFFSIQMNRKTGSW